MPSPFSRIDFDQFRVKNPNFRSAFEELCYHLFCREFGAVSGVRADFNEAGLETKPILYKGKHHGYQAKFFDQQIGYAQIKESLDKALRYFKGTLDVVHVYLNKPISSGSQAHKRIENWAAAAGVKIEWRVPSHFTASLLKPQNLDLGQLYFGHGDEFGFFKSSCDPDTTTLILSPTHLSIPLKGLADKDSTKVLVSATDKVTLILGQPGAGKSILMHDLLLGVGHVRSSDLKTMRAAIAESQVLPMLVNLKDCVAETVENVIRNRQRDYDVRHSKSGFAYLFDGLDELSPEKADAVLSYLTVLSKAETTNRIIVSCRAANPNRYLFGSYFPSARQTELDSLAASHLETYFQTRDGGSKAAVLEELRTRAPAFLSEIKDVFLLSLLWETIERLGPNYSVVDLFRQKVALLLDEPRFKKNIEELNLLDPKRDAIITLNEDISLEFQKRFQYRFTRDDLQRLILNKIPRLSYKDTNAIIAYLCSHFFAAPDAAASAQDSFIYQHRRYQEYFVARKLKGEYRANRQIIRNDFLSNGDFLQGAFLPFLRQEYERDGDLAGLLELNLIDVYLGKHPGHGADAPGYSLSDSFVPSIVFQQPAVFDRITSDENVQLGKKIEATPTNIALFWSAGKKQFAEELLVALEKQDQAAREKHKAGSPKALDALNEKITRQIEDWFYIRLVIKKEPLANVFKKLDRGLYDRLSPQPQYSGEVSQRDQVVRALLRVCIAQRGKDLEKELDKFANSENLALLEELAQIEHLPYFFKSPVLKKHAKKVLVRLPPVTATNAHAICFFRSVLGLGLQEPDKVVAREQLSKLRESRPIDLHMRTGVHKHALLAFSLGEHRFDELLPRDQRAPLGHGHFSDLGLYAALFTEFVALLRGQRSIQRVVRSYRTYLSTHERAGRAEFLWQISQLWVRIFVEAKSDPEGLLAMKRLILGEDRDISLRVFLRSLRLLDNALFSRLVNEQEIEAIAQELSSKTRENSEVVTDCFDLAILFSSLNPARAVFFISKGLNEGILRHGWRKDVIVSVILIDALEILWRNNWAPRDQLEKYARQTFDLAMRVAEITDGKGTWRGPNQLLAMVATFDLKLAEEFREKIGHRSYGHYMRNDALTGILRAKIRLGLSFEEIEKEMQGYGKDYDYEGKPNPDYFEEKLRVYLAVCRDDVFTQAEKRQSFLKAHALLEEIRRQKVMYFWGLQEEERVEYTKLCKKFHKAPNLPTETTDKFERPNPVMSEAQFVAKVRKASSTKELVRLFKQLATYETRIVVSGKESWDTIVRHTYEVSGGLEPLTRYLQEMMYPHTDFFGENSRYLHFAVAAALRDAETRETMLKYLYIHSGYEGFVNTMRALEVNGDNRLCVRLFEEFIAFCDFLVN
ncbi:MAG: hypothetical protein HYX75_10455 [Acidobacteria bacterium]|nr:hypothetical protein [Acidobacteriota bacterium]